MKKQPAKKSPTKGKSRPKVTKEFKAKSPGTSGASEIAKEVRPGSKQEKIIQLCDGTRNLSEIAKAAGTTPKNVSVTLSCIKRDHGIHFATDKEGRVRAQ
jgi:hypothetical protein